MAQNDFLPYATGAGANVEPQATYNGSGTQVGGVQTGKANSAEFNKALRLATMPSAALAAFISQQLGGADVLDDGNLVGLTSMLTQAMEAFVGANGLTLQEVDAAALTQAAPAANDNSTRVPNTAWVTTLLAALIPTVSLSTIASGGMNYLIIRFAPNSGNGIEVAIGTGLLNDGTQVALPNGNFSYAAFQAIASVNQVVSGGRTINNLYSGVTIAANSATAVAFGTDNNNTRTPGAANIIAFCWRQGA